jgi:hypothetical protein
VKGLYKHFKGAVYKVIGKAKHTETGEDLVLYTANMTRGQNGGYDLAVWARPLKHFDSCVIVKGEKIKRFEKLEDV